LSTSAAGAGARGRPAPDATYRPLPEYDWLNDLLQSGKSGTMFFSQEARRGALSGP